MTRVATSQGNLSPQLTMDLRMIRHSGIGRYLRNLLPLLLPQLAARRIRILADPAVLGTPDWLTDPRCSLVPTTAPIYSLAEQALPFAPALRRCGLLWSPHYNVPLLYRGPLVVTMHDVAPLAMPQILGPSRLKQHVARTLITHAVRCASAILCVSEFTRSELLTRCHAAPERVTVTHPGLEREWPAHAVPHQEPDRSPYFLFVGNIKPNKNLRLLLQAFTSVLDQVPHRLVLAGRTHGFTTGDAEALAAVHRLGGRVRLAGEVSDAHLQSLYAGATALVLPSLYEGFGLPLLEAMQLGCPVLCSTAASLPEVAADAALFFDPDSARQLALQLLAVQRDTVAADLRRRGHQRVRDFSFERCAAQTADVLNRLLERPA